jgi:transcriptional regulator with XRE-family HTH domain
MSSSAQPQTPDPARGRPNPAVKSVVVYDGETIRKARLAAGLTVPQLGAATGAGTRTAGRWQEKGLSSDSVFRPAAERVLKLIPTSYDGDTIKRARLRAGLTIEQLAEAVGASVATAYKWQADGITDSSRYKAAVELALGLPLVDEDANNPKSLGDTALWALKAAVDAEVQRRYFRDHPGQVGGPTSWPGTQLPHPDHLVEDEDTPRRAESGE